MLHEDAGCLYNKRERERERESKVLTQTLLLGLSELSKFQAVVEHDDARRYAHCYVIFFALAKIIISLAVRQ